jgi:hypothetical protein
MVTDSVISVSIGDDTKGEKPQVSRQKASGHLGYKSNTDAGLKTPALRLNLRAMSSLGTEKPQVAPPKNIVGTT